LKASISSGSARLARLPEGARHETSTRSGGGFTVCP
jgi:hypothetical protein